VHPGASARCVARRRLLRLRRASGCHGTSCGSSRGSSSTTSPMLCDRVPRHVVRLVVDHAPSHRSTSRRSVALALDVHPVIAPRGATTRRPGLHRLYCAYAVHPDAPSRRSTSRQSVAPALAVCPVIPLCIVTTRLAVAIDILRLRRASRCISTSRGSSRGSSCRSSSTTSTTLCVRVPRHVARLIAPLVVDYFDYAARLGSSARRAAHRAARRRLLRLRRASGCLATSRGSSCRSLSTTSPMPRVRVPRHVARLVAPLVVDTSPTSRGSLCGSSSTTSTTLHVRVPQHVARLVTQLVAPLIVDYINYAARPGASSRRAARHAACRAAHRRLLHLRRASGCFSMSRGSSSTTSTTPRVRVPRHVARLVTWLISPLVVDYFAYVPRPGVSARRAARRARR
jgi:hypothetical protein